MKPRNLVVYAVAAATLGLSSLSHAHGPSQGPRYEAPRAHPAADRRDVRRDHRADRRDDRRDWRYAQQRRYHHYNARGPEFRRGHYIPREYRHPRYVVVNHRSHRLQAPPRGHQWVQVGSDYVLVAIATGLIAHLVLNR